MFYTGSSENERMRIDSNGNIAIGGTSASNFSGYVTLDLRDTTGGLIDFSEASAGVFARIQAVVNNSLNINNRQAYPLTFGTNDTERMRIDSSGYVFIGQSTRTATVTNGGVYIAGDTNVGSTNYYAQMYIQHNSAVNHGIVIDEISTGGSGIAMGFLSGGTLVGSITVSSSATGYNTSSDARLKNVLGEAKGLEIINKLNPVNFEWKESKEIQDGLIAQEVLEIVPNAVTGSEEDMYQMDYSKLVTPLIKAIQELSAEVEELKTKLESK